MFEVKIPPNYRSTIIRKPSWDRWGLSNQAWDGQTKFQREDIERAHDIVSKYLDTHPDEVPGFTNYQNSLNYLDILQKATGGTFAWH